MSNITIGIDLGGTRIKAVAIDKDGKILSQYNRPTNDGDDTKWKEAVATAVKEVQGNTERKESFIGISAPGLPNSDNTAIAFMPGRLQGLENFNWTEFLKTKSFVLNDAISAMMAEARYGVAAGKKMW
jgi:glucokinase